MRIPTKRLLTSLLTVATIAAPLVGASSVLAAAGDKPRVLVIPLQRGPNVSTLIQPKINEYFQTILEMNRKIKVTSIAQLKNAPAKAKPMAVSKDAVIAKADKELWKAKELMEKKKFMPAQKAFAKAKSLYEKRAAELVDFDKYVEAALGQATAYFKAEYDDNGEDALAEVIVLRPNTVVDKRHVPKTMLAAMKRLQMLYSRPEKGKVIISSSVPGAEVFLDGILQGTAPVTINGLYRGKHFIRVVADGHKPYAKRVSAKLTDQTIIARLKQDAAAVAPTELVQKPTSLISVAKAGAFNTQFRDYAKTLTQRHNLAGILMTYIRKGDGGKYELAAFLYDPEQGHVAELEWVEIDSQLSTMQASLLQLEERILQALAVFPRTRIVDTKSRIYDVVEQRVAARPAPTTGPVATPAPNPNPTTGRTRRGLGPKPGKTVLPPKPAANPTPTPYRPKPQAPVVVTPAPKPRPAPVLPGTKPVPPGPVAPGPVAPVPVTAPPTPSPYPVAAPPVPYPAPVAPSPYPTTYPTAKPTPTQVRPTVAPTPAPGPVATPPPVTGPTPLVDPDKGLGKYNSIGNPSKPWEDPMLVTNEEAWYEKWWVWTIVGVAVVGGATAAGVVLGTGGDTQPGYRADVKW